MTKPLTEREIDALILQANAEWDRDNRATTDGPIPGAAVRLVRLVEARYAMAESAAVQTQRQEDAK